MDSVPNTLDYTIAGYVVFAVIMAIYIASLINRWNNLKREERLLEEIGQKK